MSFNHNTHCGCSNSCNSCGCGNNCGCNCESEPCLGRVCGTSIDTEGVDFTSEEANLVYMDKIFSYNKATTCPLLFNICTNGPIGNRFDVDFTLEGNRGCGCGNSCGGCGCGGCGCNSGCGCGCTLEPNAVFKIDSAVAFLDYIETRPPGNISPSQVTLDGCCVDSVDFANGRYTVNTASVLPKIQKERCQRAGLPTKSFFLIRNAGPWDVRLSFELEGTVNTGGRTCRFKAVFTMKDNAPDISIPNGCPASFAIPNLALPCAINGIAPDIMFQFGGKVKMVNPELCVCCSRKPLPGMENDCCDPCLLSPNCTVGLSSNLVIEPSVHVEAVRKTLFCVHACEGKLPCGPEGTDLAIDDDTCPNPYAPDCYCGSGNTGGWQDNDCCNCENDDWEDDCGCENDWNNCGCGCNDNCGCGCGNHNCGCGNNSCGCGNHNCGCSNNCWGCNRPQPRNQAYQYNGCNGCTW